MLIFFYTDYKKYLAAKFIIKLYLTFTAENLYYRFD